MSGASVCERLPFDVFSPLGYETPGLLEPRDTGAELGVDGLIGFGLEALDLTVEFTSNDGQEALEVLPTLGLHTGKDPGEWGEGLEHAHGLVTELLVLGGAGAFIRVLLEVVVECGVEGLADVGGAQQVVSVEELGDQLGLGHAGFMDDVPQPGVDGLEVRFGVRTEEPPEGVHDLGSLRRGSSLSDDDERKDALHGGKHLVVVFGRFEVGQIVADVACKCPHGLCLALRIRLYTSLGGITSLLGHRVVKVFVNVFAVLVQDALLYGPWFLGVGCGPGGSRGRWIGGFLLGLLYIRGERFALAFLDPALVVKLVLFRLDDGVVLGDLRGLRAVVSVGVLL